MVFIPSPVYTVNFISSPAGHCQLLDKHLYWSLLPETPLPSLLPWQGLLNLSINITSLESPSQGPHPLFWVYCQICHPHRPAGAGRLGCDDHGNFIPDGRAWRSQELRAPGRHAVQVCLLIHLFPARLSRACCVQGPAWVLEPQPGTTGSLTSALERVLEEWETDTQEVTMQRGKQAPGDQD